METLENGGKKIKKSPNQEDILSSLPDPLLVDILSLLPIECAAATSVLSHRWRHLWTHITAIRFSEKPLPHIERILKKLTSPQIHDLVILATENDEGSFTPSIAACFSHLRDRHRNVKTIEINTHDSQIDVPAWVFECQDLVVLELCGQLSFEPSPQNSINLINLKQLCMFFGHSSLHLFGTLFKSCPLLETLWFEVLPTFESDEIIPTFEDEEQYLVDICAPYLKSLDIVLSEGDLFNLKFMIDAPGLGRLKIDDKFISSHYVFVKVSPTLSEVVMFFGNGEDEVVISAPTLFPDLVQGILSAKSLALRHCAKIINYLGSMDGGALPVFSNLTHLKVEFDHELGCWTGFLLSLRSFPNLEVLEVSVCSPEEVVEDWSVLESLPSRFLTKLKTVMVKGMRGNDSEIKSLRCILESASNLETVSVHFSVNAGRSEDQMWKENEFWGALSKLHRRSLVCQILFTGVHVRAFLQ